LTALKKTVTGAFNLNWAHTEEVGSVIERELGIPFAIDNDANVAALGERWTGAGANNPDVDFCNTWNWCWWRCYR